MVFCRPLHVQVDPGEGADLEYAVVAAERCAGQDEDHISGINDTGPVIDAPFELPFYYIIYPDAIRSCREKSIGLDRSVLFHAYFQNMREQMQFCRFTLL